MSILTVGAIPKTIAVILIGVSLSWGNTAHAAKKGHIPSVVVVRPSELPLAARGPGQAMYLRAVGFSRYLYIEQENGKRLAVFDVSRPAHVKALAEIELNAPQFEFLQAINERFVLLRFDDPKTALSLGLLDLKHPKRPFLRNLGTSGTPSAPLEPSEVDQSPPSLVEVGTGQREIITDEKLGSRFVLTAEGLWIIRHPATEQDFELEEIQFYAD